MTWSRASNAAAAKYKADQLSLRMASGVKWCPRHNDRIGKYLPIEAFGAARGRPDGRHGWCRACVSAQKRKSRAASPDVAAADRARCAARRARIEAAKAEAQAQAATAEAAAAETRAQARIRNAVSIASNPSTDPQTLAEAASLIPHAMRADVAATRAAAVAAQVAAQRQHEEAHRRWRRAGGPMPAPENDRQPEHHGLGYERR